MRSYRSFFALCALAVSLLHATTTRDPIPIAGRAASQTALTLVDELDRLTRNNWARVAGRDTGLPPHVNGHDEFAAAWIHQILTNLHSLPVTVFRQPFPTPGFRGLPAIKPGVNVVVVVPGSRHPDQAVVVGAHYDGEPFSKGSVYDDASGCVITLALSRALGAIWRTHGLPSLTVEFVLFDAEEQGLVGSMSYALGYRHGAILPRPALMIDEEQSGVGYPVRPFGLLSNPPLPSYADTSVRVPRFVSSRFGGARFPSKAARSLLLHRLQASRDRVFRQLRRSYPTLTYRGGSAPAFTPADRGFLLLGPLPLCCSDNDPFAALGVPTVTFVGDAGYYNRGAGPWSFPFDQPQDTLTALACDTGGSPAPGPALEAALALPLDLSRVLVMDYAPPARGTGIALFSTLPRATQQTRFSIVGPQHATWSFGDGGTATGAQVQHTYLSPGRYRLTVHAVSGTESRSLNVLPALQTTGAPSAVRPPPIKPWRPSELKDVPGCH